MPMYAFTCSSGCCEDRYVPLAHYHDQQLCLKHWEPMTHVISAPLMVKVAQDVCYDSPVTGEPITNWHQRKEDLKRNNCTPYDPEIKTDYQARIKREEAELDKSIEAHVEEAVEKMPTKKRAQLYSELVDRSAECEVVRTTPYA